jgi:hypothetical protein
MIVLCIFSLIERNEVRRPATVPHDEQRYRLRLQTCERVVLLRRWEDEQPQSCTLGSVPASSMFSTDPSMIAGGERP